MILLLSPSKTLDFTTASPVETYSQPEMLKESAILIKELCTYSPKKIAKLMGISDKLAQLNADRYQAFKTPFTPANAKQALAAFKGDVYAPMNIASYSKADFDFAQDHVRILSGLYGLLKPLDLIQPYRLEMGTTLPNKRGKNLYDFWGKSITDAVNNTIENHKNKIVINLASVEYFHSIKPNTLQAPLLNITFKEKHKGGLKIIGLFAKKARGMMADFVIKNRIDAVKDIMQFNQSGYSFEKSLSDEQEWVFVR